MVGALIIFVAMVAGMMMALLTFSEGSNPNANKVIEAQEGDAIKTSKGASDHGFFYRAIGQVVSPPNEEELHAPAAIESSTYTLELKVTHDRKEAERTVAKLHSEGVDAYYTPLTREGRLIYRIRQGMFGTETAAKQAAIALNQDYKIKAEVVQLQ